MRRHVDTSWHRGRPRCQRVGASHRLTRQKLRLRGRHVGRDSAVSTAAAPGGTPPASGRYCSTFASTGYTPGLGALDEACDDEPEHQREDDDDDDVGEHSAPLLEDGLDRRAEGEAEADPDPFQRPEPATVYAENVQNGIRSTPAGIEMNEARQGNAATEEHRHAAQRVKKASARSKSSCSMSGTRPTTRRVRSRPSAAPIQSTPTLR